MVEPDAARTVRYAELHGIQRRLWPALAEAVHSLGGAVIAEGSPA